MFDSLIGKFKKSVADQVLEDIKTKLKVKVTKVQQTEQSYYDDRHYVHSDLNVQLLLDDEVIHEEVVSIKESQ